MTVSSFSDCDGALALVDMSAAQIAKLSPAQLQEAHTHLLTLQTTIHRLLDRFDAVLDERYAEQAASVRQAKGRDYGVAHLSDGPLRITVDLPKEIAWDQTQLSVIAQRIAAAGEQISDYIDIAYSIPESRFLAWPPALKEQFASARLFKPGKPSFRLALMGDEA